MTPNPRPPGRCQTHFIRNLLDVCPKAVKEEFHGRLRLVFDAPDLETARRLKDDLVCDYASRAPKAVERLDEGFDDAKEVLQEAADQRRCRTAERRDPPPGRIFPNEASARRLIGAVLMEINEAWMSGHRYFDMTEYRQWRRSAASQEIEATLSKAA